MKSHSPNFENVEWDTEKLANTLKNWPPNTPINWSAVGREHGVPGKTSGQVVKEFALKRGISTTQLEGGTPR